METILESENSIDIFLKYHRNLFDEKVLCSIFSEMGQELNREKHKEIIAQILVVTLMSEGKELVNIEGVDIFEGHYRVTKAIIVTHIIDEIYDNYENFKPIAPSLYTVILNFHTSRSLESENEKIYQLYEYFISGLSHLSRYELPEFESDVEYKMSRSQVISEVERIREYLQTYNEKWNYFQVAMVNMILAGLIQNVEKFGIDFQNLKSSYRETIQKNANNLYRKSLFYSINHNPLVEWYRNECPLQVIITNASAILHMFFALDEREEDLDMEFIESINSILGGCVHLINRSYDEQIMNAIFYPRNLSNIERQKAYDKQLQISFSIVREKLKNSVTVDGYLPDYSFEFRIVVAILFVYSLFTKYNTSSGMSFDKMPGEVGVIFEAHFNDFILFVNDSEFINENSIQKYLESLQKLLVGLYNK